MRVRLLLLVALVVGAAAPAAGQRPPESFSGKPVAQVRVLVEGVPATDPALIDLIETRVGQPLSIDRKSTRLNSSHSELSRMPSSA